MSNVVYFYLIWFHIRVDLYINLRKKIIKKDLGSKILWPFAFSVFFLWHPIDFFNGGDFYNSLHIFVDILNNPVNCRKKGKGVLIYHLTPKNVGWNTIIKSFFAYEPKEWSSFFTSCHVKRRSPKTKFCYKTEMMPNIATIEGHFMKSRCTKTGEYSNFD